MFDEQVKTYKEIFRPEVVTTVLLKIFVFSGVTVFNV
jgi:hypothetical protein